MEDGKKVASNDQDGGKTGTDVKAKIPRKVLCFRLVKTGCLVFTWICIGLFTEMSGPTFKDLELRFNLPSKEATEAVSRATSGRSVGFAVGAVVGGFLVDRFKRKGDLFIGISLICAAAATVGVPWMTSFATMWFLMFCQGTFEGIINIAGQELILLLWGPNSAGPMHLLHFGFGMGSFMNPLIAQPFLALRQTMYLNDTQGRTHLTDVYSNSTSGNATTTTILVGSRIEYPYLIVAIITATFSSTFFWYQYKGVPHGGYVEDFTPSVSKPAEPGFRKYVKMIDPATCAGGNRPAGFVMFFLLFMYFFQAVGGERICSKFIRNYALDQLNFNSEDASYLNSTFWISFSVGRFVGFLVAIWIPIRILIIIEGSAGLVVATLLHIFGSYNRLAVWILLQPMALLIAPMFPSGVAWSDHYMKMSGVGITILIAGGSLGGVVYIWVLGYLYPNFGPLTFLYVLQAYSLAACLFVCFLTWAGCVHGDRFNREQDDTEPEQDQKITVTNELSGKSERIDMKERVPNESEKLEGAGGTSTATEKL